ncbi:hypothetical protein [Streptomyces sp. S.PNR 29]|uniref:hypothetical protein n=1 Tax=Streptomyces sp. S.PNR 29 TaxID=2973805 RepID=UPI0025B0F2ED|nr:hypothetical protein [Streptomyces sp. S.PNR 29]MDN0197900.1 hypothetical protein [Streptomyces sp. S.PNR 29]
MHRPHIPDPRPPRLAPVLCDRPGRLTIPEQLPTSLGYDAVGTPWEHGERIMDRLPRVGCVFADDLRWWWIVPAGSHIGVTWPPSTSYAIGAHMADPSWTRTRPKPGPGHPRLLHAPESGSPYTPPIPLYFLTCRLAGSTPHWSLGAAS